MYYNADNFVFKKFCYLNSFTYTRLTFFEDRQFVIVNKNGLKKLKLIINTDVML